MKQLTMANGEPVYNAGQASEYRIKHTADTGLKALRLVAREPYAFPGGYDILAIADDGGAICHKCLKENYSEAYHDTRKEWNTGWRITGAFTTAECDEPVYCAHCSNPYPDN
jgi:hypothetical protein